MSRTILLQQPNHALNALRGSRIIHIEKINGVKGLTKIMFFDGSVLELTPDDHRGVSGPFIGGYPNIYLEPIIDIKISKDSTIQTNSDGKYYRTLTYNFITKAGVYTLTWHVGHYNGLTYTINHQVEIPIYPNCDKYLLALYNDDHSSLTIASLTYNRIDHIDTKNFGRELIITLNNELVITINTTENGQQRIADLSDYINRPLYHLHDDNIVNLRTSESITLPPPA